MTEPLTPEQVEEMLHHPNGILQVCLNISRLADDWHRLRARLVALEAVGNRLLGVTKSKVLAVVHGPRETIHKTAVVDGELEHWTIDGGCPNDCAGCHYVKQRDAARADWQKALEEQKL